MMMNIKESVRRIVVDGAAVLLSALGFSSCKCSQKTKTTPPEKPIIQQTDTIIPRRPPGEVIAMYGTPYQRFEEKDSVREEETKE